MRAPFMKKHFNWTDFLENYLVQSRIQSGSVRKEIIPPFTSTHGGLRVARNRQTNLQAERLLKRCVTSRRLASPFGNYLWEVHGVLQV